MPKLLKDYPVHFTIAGLLALLITVAGIVFHFTGIYDDVQANTTGRIEMEDEVKKIPVIETEIINAKEDRKEIKDSLGRIENILLNKK